MCSVSRLAEGMSQQTNSTPASISPERKCTFLASRSSLAMTSTAFERLQSPKALASSGRSLRLPLSTSV